MAIFEGREGVQVGRAASVTLWCLAVFLAIEIIGAIMGWRYIGAGIQAANTISVTGHGEIYATPNIATFTYSVVADKDTVADAQGAATQASNAITAYLKSAGVADADIQTSGYSIQPRYEYQQAVCPQASGGTVIYCPPGKQTLLGYEASQSTTVKVRDLTKAGDLLAGVGQKGATNISGLQFTFDDPNAPQTQARDKAIADAKQKADVLAKQLGVTLVGVTSFTESANNGPRPIEAYAAVGGKGAGPSSPVISTGQNQVTDDVTITYEIK